MVLDSHLFQPFSLPPPWSSLSLLPPTLFCSPFIESLTPGWIQANMVPLCVEVTYYHTSSYHDYGALTKWEAPACSFINTEGSKSATVSPSHGSNPHQEGQLILSLEHLFICSRLPFSPTALAPDFDLVPARVVGWKLSTRKICSSPDVCEWDLIWCEWDLIWKDSLPI